MHYDAELEVRTSERLSSRRDFQRIMRAAPVHNRASTRCSQVAELDQAIEGRSSAVAVLDAIDQLPALRRRKVLAVVGAL
jgi:hypothetical protein